jgi:DNA-binding NarL/FixJ family response regulator
VINVVVVAPGMALRAGLSTLINSGEGMRVTGEATTITELDPFPAEVDVLVLTEESATRSELKQALPSGRPVAVLILVSTEADRVRRLSGLTIRAWGALPVDASADELVASIRALHEGLLVGSPSLMEPFFTSSFGTEDLENDALIEPLTERESEVLQLLAQGLANKQIAASLGISEHTVKFHVSAIFSKLGANSRTEAIRLGVRRGLIVL